MHLESLDDLSTEHPWWGELAQRSGNLFATQEWLAAWSRHLGDDHELLACTARTEPGAEPFAVLALCRSPGGPLRFMGHTDSDRLAPVCAPEDRALAALALRQALDLRAPGWESFLAEDLPAEEGWGHLLPGSAVAREHSPALALAGLTWDDWLATRSHNMREQVRSRERRLRRAHDVRVRISDHQTLEADLDALVRLHDLRWEGAAGTYHGPRGALHREFARTALERGWLRLRVLECDGRPVAALHAFRFGDAEWYYQAGRDPAFDRWRVGFVLLVYAIREAMEDGLREFRFLRGAEPYKRRFADRDDGLVTIRIESDRRS